MGERSREGDQDQREGKWVQEKGLTVIVLVFDNYNNDSS